MAGRLRLPIDNFSAGVQIGSMPGANPTADAIKSVVQRYNDLRTQKEKIAGEATLYQKKSDIDYASKEKRFKNILGSYGKGGNTYIKPTSSGNLSLAQKFSPAKIEQAKGLIAQGGQIIDPKTFVNYDLDTKQGVEGYLSTQFGPDFKNIDPGFEQAITNRFPETPQTKSANPFAGFNLGENIRKFAPAVSSAIQTAIHPIGGLKNFKQKSEAGNSLRKKAIEVLKGVGYPTTEANIKSAMQQLSGNE